MTVPVTVLMSVTQMMRGIVMESSVGMEKNISDTVSVIMSVDMVPS